MSMNLPKVSDDASDIVQPLHDVNHVALSHAQLRALELQGSSAFYFLDLEKLADNYRRLRQAFVSQYENSQIAYSFKTNYAPVIGHQLKGLGCWGRGGIGNGIPYCYRGIGLFAGKSGGEWPATRARFH